MRKLYFGHPINVYGTELEKFLLDRISFYFDGWEIENPNQPHHHEAYQRWTKEHGNGMEYFFKEVLPKCASGVFLPFRDGALGKGVFGEAKNLFDRGCMVHLITSGGVLTSLDLNQVQVLTVEETRARIRTPDGTALLPY